MSSIIKAISKLRKIERRFETPGVHEFSLSLDGTELGRIGFKVLVAGQATLAPRKQG